MSELLDPSRRQNKKSALGRGLGSLLGEKSAIDGFEESKTIIPKPQVNPEIQSEKKVAHNSAVELSRLWQIDISKLRPSKKQPRRTFAPEPLKELAQSIKEKGILQPIVARTINNNEFEIIAGERRWRAAQLAGLKEVPVILKAAPDQDALELALIENIQRENLNPIEEAEAYHNLISQYGMTQQQLADKLGKDRVTVANQLRLLALDKEVRQMLAEFKITMGHAKVLLGLVDLNQQKILANRVADKKLSVRELERHVAKMLTPTAGSSDVELSLDVSKKFMAGLSDELQKLIGTRVQIEYHKGKGQIGVSFFSDDQLNGLVDRIRKAWQK